MCQEGRGMDTGSALADKVRIYNTEHAKIISKIADDEMKHV